ncbi:hypothetical protein, partial [Streptomyces sp. NPDC001919]
MAGSADWKCADCDSNNGLKDTACTICGSTRRAPMPRPAAPSRPAPKRPSPAFVGIARKMTASRLPSRSSATARARSMSK